MNALTEQEKQACRKASEYYAALADGKVVERRPHGGSWQDLRFEISRDGLSIACQISNGTDFRILAPPKMRAYMDEELPELLGQKIQRNETRKVFIATDCADLAVNGLFQDCTYYDGPNAGLPVGKVCDA